MSGVPGASAPKHKLCPTCRHIYPATNNFCPRDQTALVASADIIAGRYILGQMVGAGAMGKVYLAEDSQLGRRVALKLLGPTQDAQVRGDREAKAVGALDHDNVVRVYERGQHDDGRHYISMEFLEGESLRQHLATHGRLPVKRALELWLQAVRGVAAAHKKHIVHRDLKPDNLFLARREHDDGPIEQLKVLDFGIAQMRAQVAGDRPTRGTVRIGTPGYVAPEQWMRGEATTRSDVYSLGVILMEMLTGLRSLGANPQAPLEALQRLALTQPLSADLQKLAAEILSPDPEQRPENARLLLERARSLPDRQLSPGAAAPGPRESPGTQSLSASNDLLPRAPSAEDLPPLSADDDEADTEQMGLDALRQKGREERTVRVERLPGLVPTPAAERPTAALPEKPRPPAPPPPSGDAPRDKQATLAGDAALEVRELSGLVELPEAPASQLREQVPDVAAEDLTDKQHVKLAADQLPLPAQSTLVIASSPQAVTLSLSGPSAAALVQTLVDAPVVPKKPTRPDAATWLSKRPVAQTVTTGLTATMPLGSSSGQLPPHGSWAVRLREFLLARTAIGPVIVVLIGCALLGLVLSFVLATLLGHRGH